MKPRSKRTLRWAAGTALTTLALSTTACSSAPGTPGGSEPSPAGQAGAGSVSSVAPAAVAPRADEATRVQAYLDSLYLRSDVRHEFRSKLGDDVDCVDFAAEPGVRKLLAQGMTLDEIRGDDGLTDAMREHNKTAPLNDAYFAGDLDDAGRTRACPEGTVPHVRMTAAKIAAAGGLDAHLHALHRGAKQAPPGPDFETPPGGPNYGWYQWVTSNWSVANTGGTSTMTIAHPTIPSGVNDHSLEQTWTTNGSGTGLQTLEVGWTVADDVNGDLQPHIFVYSTTQGYQESYSCYDGVSVLGCPTWIPGSGSLTVGGSLSADDSVAGGTPQHELTVTTAHHRTGHWVCNTVDCTYILTTMDGWGFWASVDGGPSVLLGYYTLGSYGTGALSGGQANDFEMGAEVCDTSGVFTQGNPHVQMGEGSTGWHKVGNWFLPYPLSGHAAYQRNYAYYNTSGIFGASGAAVSTGASAPANQVGSAGGADCTSNCVYSAGDESNAAENPSTWTNWFYFADAL